jgi:hypothetical protein
MMVGRWNPQSGLPLSLQLGMDSEHPNKNKNKSKTQKTKREMFSFVAAIAIAQQQSILAPPAPAVSTFNPVFHSPSLNGPVGGLSLANSFCLAFPSLSILGCCRSPILNASHASSVRKEVHRALGTPSSNLAQQSHKPSAKSSNTC